ncbi:PAS domain S-box protein [Rhizobium mongolense]
METDQTDVLDALPAMILSMDMNGEIKFLNRRWMQRFGLSGAHETSLEWRDLIDPRDLSKFFEAWHSIRASQKPGEVEVRMRNLNGDYRSHLLQISPAEGRHEIVPGWYVVATDVEDLRRADEGLRRKAIEFQRVVNTISVPLAVTTPEGEVEALNQPALDYFGKTLEELKGWKASDVVHPDDLEATIAALALGHATGATIEIKDSFDPSLDGFLGGTTTYDLVPDYFPTATTLRNRIAVSLSGMAAEVALFGDPSIGSGGTIGSDVERATAIARRMIGSYGLGKTPIFMGTVKELADKPLPERLEVEVSQIIGEEYERMLSMMTEERERVLALAADVVTHRMVKIERGGLAKAA